MPSRPIQTQPAGLLGFLQMKNLGKNPAELPDALTPVLEMRDWFWETNARLQIASGATLIPAATVAGNIAFLTVPPGEWWAILDLDMEVVTSAAQTLVSRLQWREPSGHSFPLSDYLTRTNTNQGVAMPRSYRVPIIGPGSTLGLHIPTGGITTAAADIPGNFVARVAVLQA